MTDDTEQALVIQAKEIVERDLALSMVPDHAGAAQCLTPGFGMIFTGGRRFSGPGESAAFNALRYRWVKKRFLRTDAAFDPETGEVRVFNTGHLYGEWPDGTPFESNRYIDIFVVREGRITEAQVWNDSAEILLARHELAEAPL
jgi:ketosteroid isomerase-like protein